MYTLYMSLQEALKFMICCMLAHEHVFINVYLNGYSIL